MDDYWETLNARVKSAEAFILGKDLRNLNPLNARYQDEIEKIRDEDIQQRDMAQKEIGSVPNMSMYSPMYITFEQLKKTIEDGRTAFNNLILITMASSFAGLAMLILAAIAGLFLQKDTITLIFGVLGISVLLAMFAMNPKEKIQIALSNMIQAQAIYLDYYNQIQIWMLSSRKATNQEERKQASEALHSATSFTLKALQEYIGPSNLK